MAEPWIAVNPRESRAYTNALLEVVEEGMLSKDILLQELLLWMSESEVADFCLRSLLLRDDDNLPIIREADEDEVEEDY